MTKRIAVIGAGPAGLTTVKALLEEGHMPVCFEQARSLGGVFRFGEKDGVVWESCRLTSSGLLTCFSDFPVAPERAGHMTAREYVDYLGEYAAAFGVVPHVRYGARVESVAREGDGRWRVRSVDEAGVTREEDFDSVAVCSGLHQHPHVPHFAGQETFPGQILHGARYRRGAQVRGKRVLVVGAGESGADIVAEVAANATETVLSLRRGVAVVSRRSFGKPRDYQTSRLLNSAAHWIFQTRNPKDDAKRNLYRTVFLPLVVADKCIQIVYKTFWEILPLFFSKRLSGVRENFRTRALTQQLLEESGGWALEQFGTKDDDFVRAIAAGTCRRVPAIRRFEGPEVVFEDGQRFAPDLVLLCTGFETRMPFLAEPLVQAPRYLHTWNPDVGGSLGFIGFLRPAFGAIPPLAELQARWFALVQSGRRALPGRQAMLASIAEQRHVRAEFFRAVKGRLEHLVDHTPFCDALAAEVGCKPGLEDLRRESRSFRRRFFAGPFVTAQYRLVGPHARPDLARRVIGSVPIAHPLPDLVNYYLRWTLTRVMHRWFGSAYRPKLALE